MFILFTIYNKNLLFIIRYHFINNEIITFNKIVYIMNINIDFREILKR